MKRQARVHRLAMSSPDDVSGLTGGIDPDAVVAVIGKTEGNGCVNDFTRAFAVRALTDALPRPASPWSCRAAPRVPCRRICWC